MDANGPEAHNLSMKIEDMESFFAGLPIGARIMHQEEVDSTNQRALERLQDGRSQHGDILVADRQTAGRGQAGRDWQSATPDGLWMSLTLLGEPAVTPLSFLPAIALCDYLCRDLGLNAHLKWPNDVLVGDRKIAGILVEGSRTPKGIQGWVVGLGLNLNQLTFPGELEGRATSVRLCCGRAPSSPEALLAILGWLNGTWASGGDLVEAWMQRSRLPGHTLTMTIRGQPCTVCVTGLTPEGYLLLRHADGQEETIISSRDIDLPCDY